MADVKMAFLLVVLLWRSFNYGEAQTCEGSKAAYAASGFSMDDVPENPVQGKIGLFVEMSGICVLLPSRILKTLYSPTVRTLRVCGRS